MTFLNATLLLGLGLSAIPILLHFLMRQKPRKLVFPALRLVQQRQRQSVRRLRLRHVWLMLLRVLALGAIVFALARPSVPPANYELSLREMVTLGLTIAAGLACYGWLLRRLRRQTQSRFQYEQGRGTLRNRAVLATLAAAFLFVGWPYQRRISAEISRPRNSSELNLPVAGVMLFDTSLSMTYLQAGQTALDQAKAIARFHLQSLPAESRIAVGDCQADRPIPFQSTMPTAQSRIDALAPTPAAAALDDRLREALKTHEDDLQRTLSDQADVADAQRKDRYIRRIYIFTDLAKSAWRTAGSALLQRELEKQKSVNIYLVDVGQDAPENLAILDVQPSGQRISVGSDLLIAASARAQGKDASGQLLELLFQGKDGELIKQGQATLRLDANLPSQTEFPVIAGITNAWVQGLVRLPGTDPLAFDNTRYFSVEVSDPPQVLVLAPNSRVAGPWLTALAPHEKQSAALNKFKPTFEPYSRIPDLQLTDYPVVALLNVASLSDDAWSQLGKYVEQGGGLIVVLGGMDIKAANYQRAPAQAFLPASLDVWKSGGEWNFSADARNHPLFSIYRRLENYGSFSMFENLVYVLRFWNVTPAEGANVLATYSDPQHSPALIERPFGQGRTVMLTTAADLPENPNLRWNNLPSPLLDSWLFLSFVEQLTNYVSRFGDEQHAFLCGQTPAVRLDPAPADRTYLLKEPNLKQSRHLLPAGASRLTFKDVAEPGHYELLDAASRKILGAFSLNAQASESDLTRVTAADLNDRLGADRYHVARSLEELKDDISAADIGQEIFPVLLALAMIVFCGEHLVANRFYETGAGASAG
jgi:hypothetical protein